MLDWISKDHGHPDDPLAEAAKLVAKLRGLDPLAALKRVYDSAAWKDFAKRNNFEDNYQGSAQWGKSLAGQQAEMSEFMAHISAPAK